MPAKLKNNLKIISNRKTGSKFYQLSLILNDKMKKAKPGQFVHIRINDGLDPFFRRPFSIARIDACLQILYDIVGPGTKALAEKKPGEKLDIVGPLGTSFNLPPRGIKQAVLIGGGVGVAPLLMLSDVLRKKDYKVHILYGGRTKDYIFSKNDFIKNGCKVDIATDDGSVGVHGRVSTLFSKIERDPQATYLYTCGPKPMMASVQHFAQKYKLRGQASCEEVMACGIGTCLGCVVETKNGYKTACHDGPVFDLDELVF